MPDARRAIIGMLPRLRRLAWAIARDSHDADDLLQRTVERVLLHEGRLPAHDRTDLWMFRIMKNLWSDERRRRNRWARIVEAMPDDHDLTDAGQGADAVMQAIEHARVRQLVEALPEEQRLAVKLVLLGGHSYAEAAAILEIPEGTLTSRLARGRSALLGQFAEKETRH